MKEENVGGSYSMETRYPFLDRDLVQEYLWLSADLKNSRYKRPLRDLFEKHHYPYREEKKGFGVEAQAKHNLQAPNLGKCIGCCKRHSAVAGREQRVAIVSAYYPDPKGSHSMDTFMTQPAVEGIPMFLFTDQDISGGPWLKVKTPYHLRTEGNLREMYAHGRYSWKNITSPGIKAIMAAEFYKINAHLLPELAWYNIIIWADANFVVRLSMEHLTRTIVGRLAGADILIAHHMAWSMRDEMEPSAARAASEVGEGTKEFYLQQIMEQYRHFQQEGFYDVHGLYHASVFAYRAHDQTVKTALQAWWVEVQRYYFRDQFAFTFIMVKFDLCVATGSYYDVSCALLGSPQYEWNDDIDVCQYPHGYIDRPNRENDVSKHLRSLDIPVDSPDPSPENTGTNELGMVIAFPALALLFFACRGGSLCRLIRNKEQHAK